MKARFLFITLIGFLVLGLMSWPRCEPKEVRLTIRSVPSDITVWHNNSELAYDPDTKTYKLEVQNDNTVQLDIKSAGRQTESVQVIIGSGETEISIPQAENQIIHLKPTTREVSFVTDPRSHVYLVTGRDKQLLGVSSEALLVPISEGVVEVLFEAAGYRKKAVQIDLDALESEQWPKQGSVVLEPILPLVSPLINWLSQRRGVAITILVILLTALLIVTKRLIQGKAVEP